MAKSLSATVISLSVGYNYTLANWTAKLSRETFGKDFPSCKEESYVEKPVPTPTFFGLRRLCGRRASAVAVIWQLYWNC